MVRRSVRRFVHQSLITRRTQLTAIGLFFFFNRSGKVIDDYVDKNLGHNDGIDNEMDDDYFVGEKLTVSGWGRLESNGYSPNVLHSVDVPFVPNTVCQKKYGIDITDQMMCAGNIEDGGIDSCQGDSGGKWWCRYQYLKYIKILI